MASVSSANTSQPSTPSASASPASTPPATAPHEPVVVVGRRALITTVIAVAMNPISLVFGYFINHWLQAPSLEVKNAVTVPVVEAKRLGDKALMLLKQDPKMKATLRGIIMTSPLAPNGPQNTCTQWLDGQTWDDKCTPVIDDALKGLKPEIGLEESALRTNLQQLRNWKPGEPLDLQPIQSENIELTQTMQMIQGGRFDPKQAIASFSRILAQDGAIVKHLDLFSKEFDDMQQGTMPRTGDLWVYVKVLNSGDSDGVIFDSGTAKIGETEVPLKADNYTVVKAHSLEQIEFELDMTKLKENESSKIKESVKKGSVPMDISLSINTGKAPLSSHATLTTGD
jgi:hypothetical protein